MNGAKPADSPAQTALPLPGEERAKGFSPGPGLSKLLQGEQAGDSTASPSANTASETQSKPHRSPTLTWTLLMADAALVGLAAWVMLSGRAGMLGTVLAVGAIILGAWLGCYAFLLRK